METIVEFKRQQAQTLDVLKKLLVFLREGEQYGVKIDPKFKHKLEIGIKAAADEKLNVALIGGVSEGKTSIAAAWAEKYDKRTMKINQEESSNEVNVYSMEDFNLIDTPGLFGFKENINKEKYKDITRKYVSEAHLVLYVMNPNNPVKESHKEELVWLFRDLKLLPRTVFVLSRFDEEVDIEDDNDYKKGLKIKRLNIIGRLKDFGLISNDNITIVAVSANPFEKGVDYWLSHLDDFRRLSRIASLQKATTEKIKTAGTSSAIMEETKKSIAIDILKRELPVAIDRDEKAGVEYDRFRQVYDEVERELKKTELNLGRTRIALREFIEQLFTNLILQANGLTIESINDLFHREIGEGGIILSTKIQNGFERQLDSAYQEINRIQISLDAGVKQYNNVIEKIIGDYAKESIKGSDKFLSSGGLKLSSEGVKIVRNIIMPSFRFKPWGAIKLANNLNIALPIIGSSIGIALELWDMWDTAKKEKEFNKGINNMVSTFEKQREEHLEFLNDEDKFINKCFPGYINLQKQLEKLRVDLQKKQLQHEQFTKWRKMGEAIEAEFMIVP